MVESPAMPTKDELERLPNVGLAVLCSKVAEDLSRYTEQGAAAARELKKQWAFLQTPPEMQFKDEQKKQAQLAEWRTRAINFLAEI
jgi:hypothetical protein